MTVALTILLALSILGHYVTFDRRDMRERVERGQLLDRIERPGTVTSVPVEDEEPLSGFEDDDEIRAALGLDD